MEWLELINLVCLPEHSTSDDARPSNRLVLMNMPMPNGETRDFADDYEVPIVLANSIQKDWHCTGYTISVEPVERNVNDYLRRFVSDGQTNAFLYSQSAAFDLGFLDQVGLDKLVAFIQEHDPQDGILFTIPSVWRVSMEFDPASMKTIKKEFTLLGVLDYAKLEQALVGVPA